MWVLGRQASRESRGQQPVTPVHDDILGDQAQVPISQALQMAETPPL